MAVEGVERVGVAKAAMRVAGDASVAPKSPAGNVTAMRPLLSSVVLRSQTDERLVALARGGHDQAFVTIAQRYRRELLAHARRLVSADRAEDIVQQATLSAWSALRARADVLEARAWLHQIVHHAALRVLQRSEDHHPLADTLTAAAGTEGGVERRFEAQEALAGLAALPEPQRRALELTALEGRSGREAAGALEISEGALRQLVYRARTTLRAGTSALTPAPLLTWAAGGANESIAARITEVCAGAGMAATVTKLCATVAVTGTLIGGATQVLPTGHNHRTQRQGVAATVHRGVLDRAPRAQTSRPGALIASGAGSVRVLRHLGARDHASVQGLVGRNRQGQRQGRPGRAGASQSHQGGRNHHGPDGRNGGPDASSAAAQGTHDTTSGQEGFSVGNTGGQGAGGADGANQP